MAYKFSIGDAVYGAGDHSYTGILSASGVSTLHAVTANRLNTQLLSASGETNLAGATNFGTENQTNVSAVGIISSSAAATFVGAVSFGAASYTQIANLNGAISSSAANDFEGVIRLGAGQQTSISAAGIISSSATPTFNSVSADRVFTSLVDASTLHGDGALLQNITAAAGPATSTSIYKRGDLETVLSGGMNYFTASTNPLNVTLPTASYGDVVYVKAGADVTSTNFIRITMSIAKSGELGNIDGAVEQLIESPFGALSLCYVEDFTWRIF